jgi:hypothetical protein
VIELRLNDALMPPPCWNTHIACLKRLCDAAGHGLELADIAGITGVGFRTALCREVTPPGLYHTWSWAECFRHWLDALGLDAEIASHRTDLSTFDPWLQRQHERIGETLARGFPVLHWDNLGFGLILGADADGYWLSGIPAKTVHPLWLEQRDAQELLTRLMEPGAHGGAEPKHAPRESIAPVLDQDAMFVYVHGTARFNAERAMQDGLYAAWAELTGHLEFPRMMDGIAIDYAPRYGTAALARWCEELKIGRVHPFGQILAVQSQAEARRWAAQYLRRVLPLVDDSLRPRLEQVLLFMERVVAHWRAAQGLYDAPLNEKEQMLQSRWDACREALYQVLQTEGTAARLLGAIVSELFAD